jgi:FtsH-binding integral membrane protein
MDSVAKLYREVNFMKKIYKFLGTALLSVAALITVVGPASVSQIAVEEMPSSIKNKR